MIVLEIGILFFLKDVSNKKLQSKLKMSEDNFTKASRQAARAELLLAEESG